MQPLRRPGSFASVRPARVQVIDEDDPSVARWPAERSGVRMQTPALPDPALLLSSDELTQVLLRAGAHHVSTGEHGNFMSIRHRLVFVRQARYVESRELGDVLRWAGMTMATCREHLAELGRSA
jgi:hypothetical protein